MSRTMKNLFSITFLSLIISDVRFIKAVNTSSSTSEYFFAGPEKITRGGEPHAVIISPPINYSLGFTIEPKEKFDGWTSIIHITTGGNCCNYGQSVPHVVFRKRTTKLQIYTSPGDTYNNLPDELALNQKHDIVVHVYGSKSYTYVNGTLAIQKTIGYMRTPLAQVEVWIGDPWHEAANAIISDVSFTEAVPIFTSEYFFAGPRQIMRPAKGKPDAVIISPPINYSLEFTIEPKGKVSDWGGILHFTTGDDYSPWPYGQRVPAIFFRQITTQFHVSTGDDLKDDNVHKDFPYQLALHQKHAIVVHVFGSKSSIYVNGTLAFQKTIGTRTPLAQVDVYIGSPWYEAANAIISDVSFTEAIEHAPTTSTPTISPPITSAPSPTTTPPTTAFQGEDYFFKNLESSFVDDGDGFAISLNYTVGKSVNRVNVTLLDKNCTSHNIDSIINVVTDKSGDSNVHFLEKVSINKQELSTSTLVTKSEGSSKGTLSFCVKAEGISENNMSVSFQQDKLNLSYDLTKNIFEVLANGLKADDISTTLTSVTAGYSIIAHRCNSSSYEAIDQTIPLQQNGLVFICIKPNSTDVEISTFNLDFVQDGYMFQVVDLGVVKSSILSSVYSEGNKLKIVSRLVTALFAKDTFTASGNANLVFKTTRRNLDSLRVLSDKDNAGEASFGMKVELQKRIDTQKQYHNISKTALSVLGTCVLLSILFVTIKKMK